MQKPIIVPTALQDYSVLQGRISNTRFNQIVLGMSSQGGTPIVTADLSLVKVQGILKLANGVEKTVFNTRLLELCKYTNFVGGYAYDPTDTDKHIQALLDVGQIDLRGSEEFHLTVTAGNLSQSAADNLFLAYGLLTSDIPAPVKAYETQAAVSTIMMFSNCLELYTGTAAAGATLSVSFEGEERLISDYVAYMTTMAAGQFESSVSFGAVWVANDGRPRNVQVKPSASQDLFAVKII